VDCQVQIIFYNQTMQYLFNSEGNWIAFRDGQFIFTPDGEWLGWLTPDGENVLDITGKYLGSIYPQDRFYRKLQEPELEPSYPGYPGQRSNPGYPGFPGAVSIPWDAKDLEVLDAA
jgi:hypothetical protein